MLSYRAFLNLKVFASTAGGLRTCTGAAFASFKKYASHFLNSDFVGTEPKPAWPVGREACLIQVLINFRSLLKLII